MRILIILVLLSFISGCQVEKSTGEKKESSISTSYPFFLDLVSGMNSNKKILLSDIADSIGYIIVMNESETPIRRVSNLMSDSENIFVAGHSEKSAIFRLDHEGKLINMIGTFGRGPDEYQRGTGYVISIDPEAGRICVVCQITKKHLIFDFDGGFIDNIPFKKNSHLVYLGYLQNEKFLKVYSYLDLISLFPENHPLIRINNVIGDSLYDEIIHPLNNELEAVSYLERSLGSPPNVALYKNEYIINPVVCDTIYKANADSVYPAFIFKKSIYSPPPEVEYGGHKYLLKHKCLLSSSKVYETQKHVLFQQYFGDRTLFWFEYDKSTGSISSMRKEYNSCNGIMDILSRRVEFGLINDLDGGFDFVPMHTNLKGTVWYDNSMTAMDFIRLHSEESLNNKSYKYPDQRQKLMSFLERLTVDDNPVIRIVYLKNYY